MGKQDRNRKAKRQSDWAQKEAEIRELVREERFEVAQHVFDKIANWTAPLWAMLACLMFVEAWGYVKSVNCDCKMR